MNIPQAIAAIAANNTAGAAELAERASEVLLQRAVTGVASSADAFRHELLSTGWALIRAQPTMAPLVNLVNTVLWKLESVESPEAMRKAVVSATEHFRRQLHLHEVAIAEAVLPHIPEGALIATNGRSTTVRAALRHAQRAGRRFRVICAEGRPMFEGRTLAAELVESGISTTLVTDALVISKIRRVQLTLVGADQLTQDGLQNKAGTYGMALASQANGVPIYSLCGSEKFLSPEYPVPQQRSWPATQIWEDISPGVEVHNYYFDQSPLDLFSGVVTEKGVLTREGLEAWLATIKLHPALLDTSFAG